MGKVLSNDNLVMAIYWYMVILLNFMVSSFGNHNVTMLYPNQCYHERIQEVLSEGVQIW